MLVPERNSSIRLRALLRNAASPAASHSSISRISGLSEVATAKQRRTIIPDE
jgi:hypothetical protein